MRSLALLLVLTTALPACQSAIQRADSPGASPLVDANPSADDPAGATMPDVLLGQWRKNDLGRAPTRDDCNQTSSTNRNFGKVLTVRRDGFSLFEMGGRLIEVHNRTSSTIDATFDTTYADQPTRARMDFALQPDGSLAVNDDDSGGRPAVIEYLRCP